jgi:uncharacterized protein YcsI (UPF0317 family)
MSAMSDGTAFETGSAARRVARSGFRGVTVGRAPGYAQANIFIVPEAVADEFAAFCAANPAACPLMARGAPGDVRLQELGDDIDIRTDLPSYCVHESGSERIVAEIGPFWRPDSVVFAIGCWLGAEGALAKAGVRMRHRALGLQGGLYCTGLKARAAGAFAAPLVVSMRPFATSDVETVRSITARMPLCHGAPLHVGNPAGLGIVDLARADWGDPVLPEPGEAPVFWPCGLTALAALENAGLPFFISHAPGAMLVTDLKEADLS